MSTGSPSQDAQHDFSRARRARLLADVARRLRGEPDDVAMILPFEEVVEALGRVGQVDRGLQVVQLDDIVGTVDRAADFDRGFRPTTHARAVHKSGIRTPLLRYENFKCGRLGVFAAFHLPLTRS